MEFEKLEALQRRLRDLKLLHSNSLSSYFINSTGTGKGVGFCHLWDEKLSANPSKKAYSGASTATCIVSLTKSGAWWYEDERLAAGESWAQHSTAILNEFCEKEPSKWNSAQLGNGNPFTVAFTLEGIRELAKNPAGLEKGLQNLVKTRIAEAELILLQTLKQRRGKPNTPQQFAEPGAAHIDYYPPTSFLTQLVIRSLAGDCLNGDTELREHVENWCRRQIEHELALPGAPSSARDPLALAYSITAFASVVDPDKLSPAEVALVARAIDCFFEAQLPDGSWPRSKPLHHYRRFGNAYCYEYETLAQLLQAPLAQVQGLLLTKLDKLDKCVSALDHTANILPKGGKGWSSGHHPHLRGAESWSTASVFQFVHQLDRLVAEAIRVGTFEHVASRYEKPHELRSAADEFKPEDFLDSKFELDGKEVSLRETVQDHLLRPILREVHHVIRGERLPKKTPIAAILFGPPGTSKTRLAKLIARHLGWPRLDIDPSHLFKSGLENIQSESNRLFNMLAALERTVVFFDEFDEMTRERTSEKADIMSRFLTTAMLPKLSRIAEQRKIVFLLATNHIEDFDFAISRPGRFDLLLPVMPPSLDEKFAASQWKGFREKVASFLDEAVRDYDKSTVALTWRRILESLTYDEFATLYDATKSIDDVHELRDRIQAAWGRATLGKPVVKPDDNSQILLDLYDNQSKKFARILNPLI